MEGGRLTLERSADGQRNWDLPSQGNGRLDWRQLVSVQAERMDISYREGNAEARNWRVPALSVSASPN